MNKKQKENILAFMRLTLYQLHPEFNIVKSPFNKMLEIYHSGDEAEELNSFTLEDRQALFMYLAIKGLEEA